MENRKFEDVDETNEFLVDVISDFTKQGLKKEAEVFSTLLAFITYREFQHLELFETGFSGSCIANANLLLGKESHPTACNIFTDGTMTVLNFSHNKGIAYSDEMMGNFERLYGKKINVVDSEVNKNQLIFLVEGKELFNFMKATIQKWNEWHCAAMQKPDVIVDYVSLDKLLEGTGVVVK